MTMPPDYSDKQKRHETLREVIYQIPALHAVSNIARMQMWGRRKTLEVMLIELAIQYEQMRQAVFRQAESMAGAPMRVEIEAKLDAKAKGARE